MKFFYVLLFVVAGVVVDAADTWDDGEDHSQHCHIDGYPTIHVNIGDSFDLPGACLKLQCKQFDLFEAVNICETTPNTKENAAFADALVKSQKCPK